MNEYIYVTSVKKGAKFKIDNLKSYRIEHSLDVPADSFEIVVGNHSYDTSKYISSGDKIEFWIDKELALEGFIDDIDLEYTNGSNDIRITGRDIIATLLDNDANPKTYNKLGLKDYLGKVLPSYSIGYSCNSNTTFAKIVVSPGENEYSVIERLCKERNLTPIYMSNEKKLYCHSPFSSTSSSYIFSNTSEAAIKIMDAQITISNDIRNEVIVYGGDFEKNKKIKGTYKDSNIKTKKRRILNESEIEKNSDAEKRAKEEFYNLNKNALIVKISTTTKRAIYINKSARVIIKKMGFDANLLVDSVTYSKDISNGSITTVTLKLMPGIGVSYMNNEIPKLPKI